MWHRLVLGLVLAGCGFHSSAAAGGSDGGPGDAGSDGAGDAPGDGSGSAADCWAHWMDGSVVIDAATVQELTELSTTADDRYPWLSSDGLRMYFSRDVTPGGHGDIHLTSRSTAAGAFGTAMPVVELNSLGDEGRVWLTPDELTIAISTTHDGPLNINMNARPAGVPFGTPDGRHLMAVNTDGTVRHDPFLTPDLLRLYLAVNTGPSGRLELVIATRPSATADFAAPVQVPGINDSSTNEGDPTLYQDERLLLFSSFKGSADLSFATRSSATASFGAPTKIPTINTPGANELDPVLSQDGCELYFASDRNPDRRFHLFHARITRR